MKHTAGHWKIVTGTTVISGRRFIANCGIEADDGTNAIYVENVANARLIAAAPELLAERDALRAENDTLLSELATALNYIATQDAENAALRKENAAFSARLDAWKSR